MTTQRTEPMARITQAALTPTIVNIPYTNAWD